MSFATGFKLGADVGSRRRELALAEERDRRAAEEHGWRKTEQERVAQRERDVDAAFSGLTNLQAGVGVDQQKQVQQTYGMTPRQIADATQQGGFEGLRTRLAGYDAPDSYDLQNVPANAAPAFQATGLQRVQPTELDVEQAMGRIAAAQRDVRGMRESLGNQKKITTETGRKAELKRINAMSDEELATSFGQIINPRPDVPAMIGYDPKKKAFTFTSDIPGFPTQVLTRAEVVNGLMGLWEQGNGDYNTGVQSVLSTVQSQRAIDNQNFTRSQGVATANADLDYKNRLVGIQERELGLKGAYYNRAGRDLRQYVDANQNVVLIDVAGLPRGKDGTVAIPAGLRPYNARPEVTTTDVVKYAESLRGTKNPNTGKAYTAEEAMSESRRILTGGQDPFMARLDAVLGGGGDPFAATNTTKPPPANGVRTPAAAPAGPSPAAQRELRERPVNMLTPIGTVEAAAQLGNPSAIAELRRRQASANRAAERTSANMNGLQ